jgi:hypothetical protein
MTTTYTGVYGGTRTTVYYDNTWTTTIITPQYFDIETVRENRLDSRVSRMCSVKDLTLIERIKCFLKF